MAQRTIQLIITIDELTYAEAKAKANANDDDEELSYIATIEGEFPFIERIVSVVMDGKPIEQLTADQFDSSTTYELLNSGDNGILVLSLQSF